MEVIRVLLVEDEAPTRALMQAFFAGREDMRLCGMAADGLEALELLEQEQPDVVLLDLIMPGLDGLGFLQRLGELNLPCPPRILVTSRIKDERIIHCALSLGANYYLVKPISFDTLPFIVRGLCENGVECRARRILEEMGAVGLGVEAAAIAAAALAQDYTGKMLLKQAYAPIIRANASSYGCVEKNIRDMVERLHQKGGERYWSLMHGIPERRPNNEVFLRRLAEKLREK
jgi:CheY-like chemotaxis protein